MKYRIKEVPKIENAPYWLWFFPEIILCAFFAEIFSERKPYVIQYKKHWWSFWKDYKEIGFGKLEWTQNFSTLEEAEKKLAILNNTI